MKVSDPDGHTWKVRRRLGWWERAYAHHWDHIPPEHRADPMQSGKMAYMVPPASGGGDWSHLAAGLQALVKGLSLIVIVPMRILVGSRWTILVSLDGHPYCRIRSGRWTASGEEMQALAAGIRRGEYPEHTLDALRDAP